VRDRRTLVPGGIVELEDAAPSRDPDDVDEAVEAPELPLRQVGEGFDPVPARDVRDVWETHPDLRRDVLRAVQLDIGADDPGRPRLRGRMAGLAADPLPGSGDDIASPVQALACHVVRDRSAFEVGLRSSLPVVSV